MLLTRLIGQKSLGSNSLWNLQDGGEELSIKASLELTTSMELTKDQFALLILKVEISVQEILILFSEVHVSNLMTTVIGFGDVAEVKMSHFINFCDAIF
jgi:hypothetical protein